MRTRAHTLLHTLSYTRALPSDARRCIQGERGSRRDARSSRGVASVSERHRWEHKKDNFRGCDVTGTAQFGSQNTLETWARPAAEADDVETWEPVLSSWWEHKQSWFAVANHQTGCALIADGKNRLNYHARWKKTQTFWRAQPLCWK